MKIVAVVLAAGKSRRMGTNKLLLRLENKTILEHVLLKLEKFETIIVTGYNPKEIKPIITKFGIKEVYNCKFEEGMTTSFQAGLSSLDSNVDAVLMVLSDTFGFRKELIEKMIKKIKLDQNIFLVSPIYQGKRGHPVLVRRNLFNAFLEIGPDKTMKEVIDRYEDQHQYVEGSKWCKIDLNTQEDYKTIKKLWKSNRV